MTNKHKHISNSEPDFLVAEMLDPEFEKAILSSMSLYLKDFYDKQEGRIQADVV